MYHLLITIQFIGIVIMLFELIYVFHQKPSRMQTLFFVTLLSAFVNTIGYLFELTSTRLETALMAVKFTYLGKVYILLCMLFFILEYCRIQYPKLLGRILYAVHTSVALLVLTCTKHKLFYTNIQFDTGGLYPHLVMSYGFFYYFYILFIVAYMFLMPTACILRYKATTSKHEKKQLVYLIIVSIIPIVGYFIYLSGVTYFYDTTALSYVICTVILLFSIFKYNLFDTLSAAKDNVLDNLANAIIVIDNANELLYANEPAKLLFPVLQESEHKVGSNVVPSLLGQAGSDKLIFSGSSIYSGSIRNIYYKDNLHGKMILFDNITDSYNYTRRLEQEVHHKTKEMKKVQHVVISSFANMVEARDGVTGQHVKRTSAYVEIISKELKLRGYYPEILTEEYIEHLIHAAPLHDIGKIAIPDAILCKPGHLTPEEFRIIQTHSEIGAHMIEDILKELKKHDYLEMARDMAYYHHEKWDGTGYPNGIKQDQIPLAARIMAISDVYDALTSKRSYKDSIPQEKALSIISDGRGTFFDPIIVDVFLDVIDQISAITAAGDNDKIV